MGIFSVLIHFFVVIGVCEMEKKLDLLGKVRNYHDQQSIKWEEGGTLIDIGVCDGKNIFVFLGQRNLEFVFVHTH